jgi:probable HAF family extracellular repeat protein
MSSRTKQIGLATLLAATALAAHAQAQTNFAIHRLGIAGNNNLNATAINDNNAIVATLFDTAANTQSGIILQHGTATTLPAPYSGSGAAIPQAINSHGDVLGYTYEGYHPIMFLWQNGQYNQAVSQIPLEIEQEAGPPPLPIGLNARDEIFYTIITGHENPTDPIYGKIANLRSMPTFLSYQTARSNNQAGMIAGNSFYESQSEVFVGKKKKDFTILLPAGAVSSNGGFVNDKGEVAGTYTDSSNVQHGFTWLNGTYTSFDLPEQAQPYSTIVTGINESGRVVGIYTSASTNMTHAFLYNGSTVTAFGQYDSANTVSVAINSHGAMLVAVQIKSNPTNYASYRVTCSGAGC